MQQRSEETREHILMAALKCFSRAGYDATGVAEICTEAGVSKGAFYHHFPSKQAVFLKLLDDWLTGIDARIQTVQLETENVPEAMVQMSGLIGEAFQDAQQRLPMFLEFWTQASRDPQIWQATIEPYHRFEDLFAGILRKGMTEGSLEPCDPQVGARILLSTAIGLFLQGILDPQGADWVQVTAQAMQTLMRGFARRAR